MSDQPKGPQGITGGLTNYGDPEFARYLRRSFAKSMGYTGKSLDKPIVGICYTESGFNNCHRHFPEMLEAVKRGILAEGGLPVPFPVISLGEVFLNPTSLVYRNLMAMATEEMIRAQPMDSVVLMGGCDKTVPALLMGAASAGKPAVMLVAGPMMTGRHRGERLGACTDCRRFWGQYRAGNIDEQEINQIEGRLAVTAGTCAVMGTASTMALIAETLGFALPGSAAIPAVHADRLRASEESGTLAVKMALTGGPTPNKLITRASVENAIRVLLAISGSTNAVIHLAAIAGRMGIDIDFDRFNSLSDETPVLVDLKPVGASYMEDFYAAGALDGVLQGLAADLDKTPIDVTSRSLGDRLTAPLADPIDHAVIRKADDPIHPKGGLIALKGTLAPDGAILKRAAATPELLEHEGRAVVFSSLEDLANRIDDPDLDVAADDVLVLQNAGPRSASGMPEAGYLPIPKKLARQGVKDMVRISDARMSGTAFGTIVLHVAPEAELGGPLALVRDGDRIRLSASSKSIDILVTPEELDRRRSDLVRSPDGWDRGYRKLYRDSVLPAPAGCDFDFLRQKP
ncbi:dihydroxy-acid dehydratase [Labrenzia sp. C1B10]|uniref:dihydroxy-acid dehydratase n=1 Tax=unclassified Labrenzia TaxID=2648686 RepID=UPI0003B8A574|nr:MULTISPECIES: dihydroxy-acid dehydratase [unclassified Labrenzia]ERP94413.1 dihydroxy-acid dehydratase [Labrenzia sp. C1B10]ERS09614.1 dihydroxy-acid dehydratase [Labrenzia sp. C1B70]QFT01664.1 L-arabonate dehydratase [Labrenzia sp. THAF191b]QFT07869.1 L-arabonate dehydratase [Labrenzia sp. THAF191a]QFT19265.1 L-arabonate dehydratase [Labrenzia sp. THAF187b]